MAGPLFQVEDLSVRFGPAQVVHGVSLAVEREQTLGVLGESGSGKSISLLAALRLLEPRGARVTGRVLFDGRDLLRLPARELRALRGKEIGLVFQDPSAALDPTWTIGHQLGEALRAHERIGRRETRARAVQILRDVGVPAPEERLDTYPHELSGGLKQRAMIAIALAARPRLLIADEPTSALDLTVQAQVLTLLLRLKKERGLSLILVTHDLALARKACDQVVVMQAGRVVESGAAAKVLSAPSHRYTASLLSA